MRANRMKDGACLGGGSAAPATNCERGTSELRWDRLSCVEVGSTRSRPGLNDDDFLSIAMHRQCSVEIRQSATEKALLRVCLCWDGAGILSFLLVATLLPSPLACLATGTVILVDCVVGYVYLFDCGAFSYVRSF